jgi:hypothetical protein
MNSPLKIRETKKSICSRILTPKQVGPICWFMATFVVMFYSQRSRKILLDASKGWVIKKGRFPIFWNNREKLFTLLKHILDDKYLKVESRESKDYKKFSDNTFRKVLKLLNKMDKKSFPYIPKYIKGGFNPEYYIGKLYKLLNVDYIIYEYNVLDNLFAYSVINEDFDIVYRVVNGNIKIRINENDTFKYIEENIIPPPILMVVITDDKDKNNTNYYKDLFPDNIIKEGATKNNLTSMSDKVFFKGIEYNLDSVILSNWNLDDKNGHAIAGITCKKDRYIYNGWTRTSMDPLMAKKYITRKIPCELMKHKWNIKSDGDFCLNTAKCIPETLQHKLDYTDMCFNFSKGDRVLVYVRKNTLQYDTSGESYSYTNGGRILPRITINKNVVKLKPLKPPKPLKPSKQPKKPKICPEGKVLNPKTNRCILVKHKK